MLPLEGQIQLKPLDGSFKPSLALSMVLHHHHHHDHRSAFSLTALSYSIHVHRVFAPTELIHQHFVSCEYCWDCARCAEQTTVAPKQHGEVKNSILLRSIIMVWSYHTATVVGFNRSHHKTMKKRRH